MVCNVYFLGREFFFFKKEVRNAAKAHIALIFRTTIFFLGDLRMTISLTIYDTKNLIIAQTTRAYQKIR
jgi:hypothetical protein